MKPFKQISFLLRPKVLLLAAVAAVIAMPIEHASATTSLTVDLEAVAISGCSISGSNVTVTTAGAQFTVDIYADVHSSTFNSSLVYGVQTVEGTILSGGGDAQSVKGGLGQATLDTAFSYQVQKGLVTDLNSDGSVDLGDQTNATALTTKFIMGSSQLTNSSLSYASNGATSGYFESNQLGTASFKLNPFGDGYQFLIGTAIYTVSGLGSDSTAVSLKWFFPNSVTSNLNKTAMARWDSEGTYMDGKLQLPSNTGEMLNVLVAVPEPGTWAMMLGGFGMLAMGRRLRRRS